MTERKTNTLVKGYADKKKLHISTTYNDFDKANSIYQAVSNLFEKC